MIRITAALLLALGIAGCAIKPWKAPNHREEGPKGGLFSGPEGAWTIGVNGNSSTPPLTSVHPDTEKRSQQ